MFCTNCGKKIAEGSRFCTFCGAPVAAVKPRDDAPAAGPSTEQGSAGTPTTEPSAEQGATEAAEPAAEPASAQEPAWAAASGAPIEPDAERAPERETASDVAPEPASALKPEAATGLAEGMAFDHADTMPAPASSAPDAAEADAQGVLAGENAEPAGTGSDATPFEQTETGAYGAPAVPEQPTTLLDTQVSAGTQAGAGNAFDQQPTVVAPPTMGAAGSGPATWTAPGFAPDQQAGAPQAPKRKRGGLIAAIVILVLVLAVAATVGILFALGVGPFARTSTPAEPPQSTQPDDEASTTDDQDAVQIEVPNVVGMDEHDAMSAIRDAGLSIGDVTEDHSSTVPEGAVIEQTPDAGDEADEDTEVDLVVSQGPETTIEHRYQLVTEARTWSDAQAYCEAHGGYLATVESADEYQQVLSVLPSSGTAVVWLGASRVGDGWEWVDGEPMNFSAWAAGEPNDDGGNEDCLVLLKVDGSWAWYDVPNDVSSVYSSDKLAFVMETEVEVPVD